MNLSHVFNFYIVHQQYQKFFVLSSVSVRVCVYICIQVYILNATISYIRMCFSVAVTTFLYFRRHGVKQIRTAWADGPEFITQCPIRPGGSYTYRFTIQGQEGTLWWHAHSSWLRATVYGALIIYPKEGEFYPFSKPKRETPILLGTELLIPSHFQLNTWK